jgi:hypothetical protein
MYNTIINIQDSQSPIDFHFFLMAMPLQQMQIDRLNVEKKKKGVILLDFIPK